MKIRVALFPDQPAPPGSNTCWRAGCRASVTFNVIVVFALLMLTLGPPMSSRGDTWATPKPLREIESANRQFLLQLRRGGFSGDRSSCQAVILQRTPEGTHQELAQLTLENDISPVDAYISDDGQVVVTLDDWHRVGYGDQVVAFYNREGLVKKYALEEILSGIAGLGSEPGILELRNRFSHSVSSRWWRDTNMVFLRGEGEATTFAVWLSWAREWLIWRCRDGVSVRDDPNELRSWEAFGRDWALRQLAVPEVTDQPSRQTLRSGNEEAEEWSRRKSARYAGRIQACQYLAALQRPTDRKIVESLLLDAEEEANWVPMLRIQADAALAFWDGAAKNLETPPIQELRWLKARLYRLGHLRVRVELPGPVQKNEGQVYLTLLPETVAEADWRSAVPARRGGKGSRSSFPAEGSLELSFPAILPGRYWVKVVWDRTPPFAYDLNGHTDMRLWKESNDPAPTAVPGDYQNDGRSIIEVRAGETMTITVACDSPGRSPPEDEEGSLALRVVTRRAAAGDVDSQYLLGYWNYNGHEGLRRDLAAALHWYELAAEQNEVRTQTALGVMVDLGQGVQRQPDLAVQWFRKAAEQGYAPAQFNLGVALDIGDGVTPDPTEAFKWFLRAAEQGMAKAQCNVGGFLAEGRGVSKDEKEAVKWYRLAADQGHALAQVNLGNKYLKGQGVQVDEAIALKWFLRAAEQGEPEGQFSVAWCYYGGQGAERNLQEAFRWFHAAAEQGHAGAQCNLGKLYVRGEGVPSDLALAFEWTRRAAEQDLSEACFNLGNFYFNGRSVEPNLVAAMGWYRRAAELGDANAQRNLAVAYHRGLGVAVNDEQSLKWLLVAKKCGLDGIESMIATLRETLTHDRVLRAQSQAEKFQVRLPVSVAKPRYEIEVPRASAPRESPPPSRI